MFLFKYTHLNMGFPGLSCKEAISSAEKQVRSLGQEDPLEKEMATDSQYYGDTVLPYQFCMVTLYSCRGYLIDGGDWQASVPGVAKSQTQLSD